MTRRHCAFSLLSIAIFALCGNVAVAAETYDVVVVGATPGGIATSITAARLGHRVALVEYHHHVGGMSASGLGKSDILTRSAVAGLFTEFTGRVLDDYVARYGKDSDQVKHCRNGYFYEPSVAERIFRVMLADQPSIHLMTGHRLEEAIRRRRRLVGIRCVDRNRGESVELRGRIFVDATYEGDLAAFAGARYRLGREARGDFDESHAGVIYMDHSTLTLLEGSTGVGDDRLPAYTFRLCLSTNPANSVRITKPDDYDRSRYLNYFDDLKLKRLDTAVRALSIAPIPNDKTDVNMKPWPLGFPFAGENYRYPEANWQEREQITRKLRNITLGLVYFLQNDSQLSAKDRQRARQYGLAKDEFVDNDNFPWQLYVREARRVIGGYTLSEHDLTLASGMKRTPIHRDAIASAAFPIDSFPTRKREPGRNRALEGYLFMMRNITRPYQIPYRCIVPQDVDGLLVPVPLSATHIAFSAVRMEPTWMAIGQAAGTAAHLSLKNKTRLRDLSPEKLQRLLLAQGQVISHFDDRKEEGPFAEAVQYFGTKGFFHSYKSHPQGRIRRSQAVEWIRHALEVTGMRFPSNQPAALRWKDFGPGQEGFESAAALALAGMIERFDPTQPFRPEEHLGVDEFSNWLLKAAIVLGLAAKNDEGKPSRANRLTSWKLEPERWRHPNFVGENRTRPLLRGEVCQALYLLLERAGF